MDKRPRVHFFSMIGRRLDKPGPPPTVEELQGIKELATEHLWHPELTRQLESLRG